MRWFFLAVTFATLCGASRAEDLFVNRNPSQIEKFAELKSEATMGGYPIYQGGLAWRFLSSKATSNNLDIRIGSAQLISPMGSDYFAEMYLYTNLSTGQLDAYYAADLCNPGTRHLHRVSRVTGRADNCLIIDPVAATIGGTKFTLLMVRIRNSQSSFRLYDLSLFIDLARLGFPNSAESDWTEESVSADPRKKLFMSKVISWSSLLQDGVNKAIAFSQPKDAFDAVPPISTLIVANAP